MPKHLFKPGQSGNPAGRPLGSKNKQYLTLEFWFEYIHDSANKLSESQKVAVGLQCLDKLLAKMPTIPQTPEDSLKNATAKFDLIKQLENNAVPPSGGEPTIKSP